MMNLYDGGARRARRRATLWPLLAILLWLMSAAPPAAQASRPPAQRAEQRATDASLYRFPCTVTQNGNWAVVRNRKGMSDQQLLDHINTVGRYAHGYPAQDLNHNNANVGPRTYGICDSTTVLVARDGVVVNNSWNSCEGWRLKIRHADGQYSSYVHLAQQSPLAVNQSVTEGQTLGTMGLPASSSCGTGVHLHFAILNAESGAIDGWLFKNPIQTQPAYAGKYVSQDFESVMMAGERKYATIKILNIGTATWDSNTRIAPTPPDTPSPFYDPETWLSNGRIGPATGPTAPGQVATFTFVLKAPPTPGHYIVGFALMQEGVTWFTQPPPGDIYFPIQVVSGALANSSYEQGTAGWTTYGTGCNYTTYEATGSTPAFHGQHYLAANRGGTQECLSVYQDLTYPMQAGVTYRFAVWLRSADGQTREGMLALWGLDSGENEYHMVNYSVAGSNWQCIETALTPTDSHPKLRAEIYMLSLGGADFHVDATEVRAGGAPLCMPPGYGSGRQQAFIDAFERNGGATALGSPTTATSWTKPEGSPRAVIQQLSSGSAIIHDEAKDNPNGSLPAYVISGPLLQQFQAEGSSSSWLGVGPTSDTFLNSQGRQQSNFPNGFITWNGTTASVTPWPGAVDGQWRAEYFNGSNVTSGPTWVQNEAALSHNWGTQAPGAGSWGVWPEQFTAIWEGSFEFAAGTYSFSASADEHVRIWIDGVLVLNTTPNAATLEREMTAGLHELRVELVETQGAAQIDVRWRKAGATQTFIPLAHR